MLEQNLTDVFGLPQPAVEWLLSLFDVIQTFDDLADGDPVDRPALDSMLWSVLAGFYQNPFFVQHMQHLVPLIAVQILKWQASDRMEREGLHNPISFVWRAGFYDIVLAVVQLCHGARFAMDNAHHVAALYGESLDDYMQEFNHA